MQLTLSPEELRALLDPWITRTHLRGPLDLDKMTEAGAEHGMLEGWIEQRRATLQQIDDTIIRQQQELARLEELKAQAKADASDAMVWQRLEEIAEAFALHVSEDGLNGFSDSGFKFWILETRRLAAALCSTLGVDVQERQEERAAGAPATRHDLTVHEILDRFGADRPAGGTVRVSHLDSDEVVTIAKAKELLGSLVTTLGGDTFDGWYNAIERQAFELGTVLGVDEKILDKVRPATLGEAVDTMLAAPTEELVQLGAETEVVGVPVISREELLETADALAEDKDEEIHF
jgi:hypothetical protein